MPGLPLAAALLLLGPFAGCAAAGGGDSESTSSSTAAAGPRRLSIALYGAPNSNLTSDQLGTFQRTGVTDAWIPYLQGAFAVDCCKNKTDGGSAYRQGGLHAGLVPLAQARQDKLVETYAQHSINAWFFERPVPDFEWTGSAGTIGPALWNSSAEADAKWAEVVANISAVYPQVRKMGFAGLVFDTEGYYSGVMNDPGPVSRLWWAPFLRARRQELSSPPSNGVQTYIVCGLGP